VTDEVIFSVWYLNHLQIVVKTHLKVLSTFVGYT